MPASTDDPVAVRATGFIGESRWRRRPVSRVRYDACWADGRVEFDVSLTAAMYRGWPADFGPIRDSVHANFPEVGTGRWVNGFAAVVDGPDMPVGALEGPEVISREFSRCIARQFPPTGWVPRRRPSESRGQSAASRVARLVRNGA